MSRLRWTRWWVVRDDGERCSGPFTTEEEATRVLNNVYDTSEYFVERQDTAALNGCWAGSA